MASRTTGCDRSLPQTSGSGERATTSHQQTRINGTSERVGGKENHSLKPGAASASPASALSGSGSNDLKSARWARYQDRYQAFVAEAEKRHLKRKDLEARNKMWQEEGAKSQARLKVIEHEHEQLLRKIGKMQAAQESYNAANRVCVSAQIDGETKEKWDAFLRMETDELDV